MKLIIYPPALEVHQNFDKNQAWERCSPLQCHLNVKENLFIFFFQFFLDFKVFIYLFFVLLEIAGKTNYFK